MLMPVLLKLSSFGLIFTPHVVLLVLLPSRLLTHFFFSSLAVLLSPRSITTFPNLQQVSHQMFFVTLLHPPSLVCCCASTNHTLLQVKLLPSFNTFSFLFQSPPLNFPWNLSQPMFLYALLPNPALLACAGLLHFLSNLTVLHLLQLGSYAHQEVNLAIRFSTLVSRTLIFPLLKHFNTIYNSLSFLIPLSSSSTLMCCPDHLSRPTHTSVQVSYDRPLIRSVLCGVKALTMFTISSSRLNLMLITLSLVIFTLY